LASTAATSTVFSRFGAAAAEVAMGTWAVVICGAAIFLLRCRAAPVTAQPEEGRIFRPAGAPGLAGVAVSFV
jgi:hypothetical protein